MEFKGSRGNWKFNDVSMSGKPHFNVIGTALGGKFKIANVPFVDGDKADMQEAKANAKLIASAPELLEALFAAKTELEMYIPVTDVKVLDKIDAAIRKALHP